MSYVFNVTYYWLNMICLKRVFNWKGFPLYSGVDYVNYSFNKVPPHCNKPRTDCQNITNNFSHISVQRFKQNKFRSKQNDAAPAPDNRLSQICNAHIVQHQVE